MDDIQKQLDEQKKLLEAIYTSVEKTRKIFIWTMIVTVILFILPLIGLVFVIPQFISSYTGTINGLQ